MAFSYLLLLSSQHWWCSSKEDKNRTAAGWNDLMPAAPCLLLLLISSTSVLEQNERPFLTWLLLSSMQHACSSNEADDENPTVKSFNGGADWWCVQKFANTAAALLTSLSCTRTT
jgi:hypothetical protein